MAAIVQAPHAAPTGRRPPARPTLRVLEGGKSPRVQRVYRRRRAIAVLAGAVLLALAVLGALQAARSVASQWGGSAEPPGRSGAKVVVVQPGDTLWSIAGRVQHRGDLRPLVDRLSAEHGAGPLQPGERITITP